MTRSENKPIRILQVVGGMNRGGVETWLMHVLRHIDRKKFQMDFLVHTTHPCAYDDEIRALGSKVIPCLYPRQPWIYARNFKRILRDYGPYDVVHSHVHHYSGYILRLAHKAGVPIRIAHSHNDTSSLQAKARFSRRMYLALTKRWIYRNATRGLACSQLAAIALFGNAWRIDPRWKILYYGVDFNLFKLRIDKSAVRAEFGIPDDAFVIGQVGRFAEQKNHCFLIDIAVEIARREPKMCLLLVGDGPLRPIIEHKAAKMGLTERVVFAGLRSDVPSLMLGAMDVFLLPSLYEGLPVVGIEAQAAGLPFILSDVITKEVDVVKPLVRRLSLEQPASAWAEAILAARDSPQAITQSDALAIIEQRPFNIQRSIKELENIYSGLYHEGAILK